MKYQHKTIINTGGIDFDYGWSQAFCFESLMIIFKAMEQAHGAKHIKTIQIHPVYN